MKLEKTGVPNDYCPIEEVIKFLVDNKIALPSGGLEVSLYRDDTTEKHLGRLFYNIKVNINLGKKGVEFLQLLQPKQSEA